jgi:hypothetical protein
MKHLSSLLIVVYIVLSSLTTAAQNQSHDIDYRTYPYWVDMMQDPNANFFETQKAFYTYWEGREMTKGSGYKAFKRWEYWMARKVSPDGTKPSPDRTLKALETLQETRSTTTNGNWTSLGPNSVPSG